MERLLGEMLRFGVVGVIGASLNYGIFLFFFWVVGFDYRVAGVLGFVLALPPAYFANRRWTFRSEAKVVTSLPIYYFTNLVALCAHVATQWFVGEILNIPKELSQIVGIGVAAATSFFLVKKMVFRGDEKSQNVATRAASIGLAKDPRGGV
ncbi:MAG: GtrA family protein [Alphaproteobacteria bacterium]|nr:GtrA family protein [Alphaproteobacteria bacterium]